MILSIIKTILCANNKKKHYSYLYTRPKCIHFNFAHELSREIAFTQTASLFRLSIVLVNYQWNVRGTLSCGVTYTAPGACGRKRSTTSAVHAHDREKQKKKTERKTFVFDNQRMSHPSWSEVNTFPGATPATADRDRRPRSVHYS